MKTSQDRTLADGSSLANISGIVNLVRKAIAIPSPTGFGLLRTVFQSSSYLRLPFETIELLLLDRRLTQSGLFPRQEDPIRAQPVRGARPHMLLLPQQEHVQRSPPMPFCPLDSVVSLGNSCARSGASASRRQMRPSPPLNAGFEI